MQRSLTTTRPSAPLSVPSSPYAHQVAPKTPPWGGLTAWDILCHNLSLGLFMVATVGSLVAPTRFEPLLPLAYPLALLLLLIDLGLLVSDLGDPRRFHHMLRVFKTTSPMSVGTWSLTLYGILLGIAALTSMLHWPWLAALHPTGSLGALVDDVGRTVGVFALVPALGALLYKGVLFSATSQPGWKEARWLGAYITNSALLLGGGALLILAAVVGQSVAADSLRLAMIGLLLVDVVFFWLVYHAVAPTFKARYGPNEKTFFWLAVVLAGWVIPFALLLQGSFVEMLPPLFLLVAAIAVRYALVMLPHQAGADAAMERRQR